MCNANNLLKFLIALLSVSSIYTHDHDHDFLNSFFQEESGYDFRGYPSYISPIELTYIPNSVQIEPWFSENTRVAASPKTLNVLDFGAKGDGKSDDTKVCRLHCMHT